MAECLHLYFGLKAGFELEGKVVIVNRDLLDRLPDQPFIVVRHPRAVAGLHGPFHCQLHSRQELVLLGDQLVKGSHRRAS